MISNDNSQIEFDLSYANLEGDVQQAHIHFAQKGVNHDLEGYSPSSARAREILVENQPIVKAFVKVAWKIAQQIEVLIANLPSRVSMEG